MATEDSMVKVKQFWNDIAQDFDAIYTGEKKGAFTRALDRVFRKDIYQRLDWVMRMAGDVRGQTICDIGCGSGRFVAEFARRGATRVVGVDVAPNMLKLASDLVTQQGTSAACQFVHLDVLDWITSEKFDTTIAIGLWDYIEHPAERLRIIHQMTKGKFLSAWPRFWTWRMPIRKVRLTLAGCPVYFFRRAEVYQYLEEAGFRIESCRVIGKLFCVDARPR
jgi:2-polyprenyl-3-methyl-5-hydroxy-6-metoxy-1,4-benzoquinol methylase